MASITKELFGKTRDDQDIYIFTLRAENFTVNVLNFGGAVRDILVPDRNGKISDVCLGYDTILGYEDNPAQFGALCGRVSNRIAGANFVLDGVKYNLSKNDPIGHNTLHGGLLGLTRRVFDWTIEDTKLILTHVDKDGAEGFPGTLTVNITYQVTAESELVIDYRATTSKPTPIDLSHHIMFNLSGHGGGYIGDHTVTINAKEKLDYDDEHIPTGKISKVEGTVLDLQKPSPLVYVLDKLNHKDGLHYAFVLSGEKGKKKLAVRAEHPESGRYVEISSTEPACVSYSGFYMDTLLKGTKCEDGVAYHNNGGLVFMPQGYPDAVNHSDFPSCILRPDETYHTTTWYKFGVTA